MRSHHHLPPSGARIINASHHHKPIATARTETRSCLHFYDDPCLIHFHLMAWSETWLFFMKNSDDKSLNCVVWTVRSFFLGSASMTLTCWLAPAKTQFRASNDKNKPPESPTRMATFGINIDGASQTWLSRSKKKFVNVRIFIDDWPWEALRNFHSISR